MGPYTVTLAALGDSDRDTGRWDRRARGRQRAPGAAEPDQHRVHRRPGLRRDGGLAAADQRGGNPPGVAAGGLRGADRARRPRRARASYYPSGRRTFARLVPSSEVEARALAGWMASLGAGSVALAYDGLQEGLGQGREIERALQAGGIQVVDLQRVSPRAGAGELTSVARDLAAARTDAVLYAGASPATAARLLRAVARRAPSRRLFATSGVATAGFAAALGAAESRVRVTSPLVGVAHRTAAAARFADRYRRAFGVSPPPEALYGYEAMRTRDRRRPPGAPGQRPPRRDRRLHADAACRTRCWARSRSTVGATRRRPASGPSAWSTAGFDSCASSTGRRIEPALRAPCAIAFRCGVRIGSARPNRTTGGLSL